MSVYEGLWDCTSCGAQGLRGSQRACSGCGAPRADDVKFYLPQEGARQVVTDAAGVAAAKAGEDWYCEHCGNGSPAARSDCSSCGAPRGDSKGHAQAKADEVTRRTRDATAAAAAKSAAPKITAGVCLLLGLLGLLSCCCLAFLARPTQVEATVVARAWERSQDVEVQRTVTEEGWETPAGGRVQRQEQRVHHQEQVLDHHERRTRTVQVQVGTRQVKDGVRDLGNGYFEDVYRDEPVYEDRQESYDEPVYRDEPRYATWYVWEIERWVTVRTERATGSADEPRWPEVRAGPNERAGARREAYRLELRDGEGKSWAWTCPDEARWRALPPGCAVTLTASGNEVRDVQPKAAR